MSVVKSKRAQGRMRVITKSHELAEHTIRICSNEKNFPKRYRWCITAKIVDSAIEISSNLERANAIFVKTQKDYELRREYQLKALAETYSLHNMMRLSFDFFGFDTDKMCYWTMLLRDTRNLIRNWIKSEQRG